MRDNRAIVRFRTRLHAFRRDEGGAMVAFTLYIFVLMLLVGGIAVDLMHFETKRIQIQNTADSCVISAAALSQKNSAQAVCDSYFQSAGLEGYYDPTSVTPTTLSVSRDDENGNPVSQVSSRAVTLNTYPAINTFFMRTVGIDTLAAMAPAGARERVTDIEVSLVVDTSQSMADGSRMDDFRSAANTFIDLVMPRAQSLSDQTRTSVSLVPFSMSVSLPPWMEAEYAISDEHAFSNCVAFRDADFATTALGPGQPLDRFAHFDSGQNGTEDTQGYDRIAQPLCPRTPADGSASVNALLPLETDPEALKRAIDDLQPFGASGVDAGLKWGVAMLDPATQPVTNALIFNGRVHDAAVGRPYAYHTGMTMKVLVLLSDGDLDGQRDLAPALRGGLSNVWYDAASDRYSVLLRNGPIRRIASSNIYIDETDPNLIRDGDDELWYWPEPGTQTGGGVFKTYPASPVQADEATRNDWDLLDAELVRLTHAELFDRFPLGEGFWTDKLYQQPRVHGHVSDAEWASYGAPRQDTSADWEAASRTVDLCEQAKASGIAVYTIAFETESDAARELMQSCASAAGNYFEVGGANLEAAFVAVADQLQQLRLTQ